MTPNPIKLSKEVNLFSYVRNNPIVYIDPAGLECVLISKIPIDFRRDVNKKWDEYGSWGLENTITEGGEPPIAFWLVSTCICSRQRSGIKTTSLFVKYEYIYFCYNECETKIETDSAWDMLSQSEDPITYTDRVSLTGSFHMNESAAEFYCAEKCKKLNQL